MEQSDANPDQLKQVAVQLSKLRDSPPTLLSSLLTWPGTPLLVLVGVAGTAILTLLVDVSDQVLTSHWPIGLASMIFGACLRDFGFARRVKTSGQHNRTSSTGTKWTNTSGKPSG